MRYTAILNNSFLRRCEELKQLGFRPELEAGDFVGRGYADVGLEAFLLITEDKLVSLLSGQVSSLPAEHRNLFFLIPSIEDVVQLLQLAGITLEPFVYEEQRIWRVGARSGQAEPVSARAPGLQEACINLLIELIKRGHVPIT